MNCYRRVAAATLDSVSLAAHLLPFVEAAGKEASARRRRARQVVAFAIDFYRQLLRTSCGVAPEGDPELLQAVEKARAAGSGNAETAAACIDRSLEAVAHLDRNAHQATLLECWLDDLGRIVESGHPVAGYAEY